MTDPANYHVPVLFHTSLESLKIQAGGTYLDMTFGGGGHSRGILSQLGPLGRLIAFDQDPDARANVPDDQRFTLVPERFDQLQSALHNLGITQVDGILADLGISSHQIDTPERGFSYRFDAPLDMRMNPESEETAADVLNSRNHGQLARIFREYGDLDQAGKIATRILDFRRSRLLMHTPDLLLALEGITPKDKPAAFLSRVYQALRIEVNQEMEVLRRMLTQSLQVLKPGGRLVIISYHSLEDRSVKHFFRSGNFEDQAEKDFYGNSLCPWKVLTRQAVIPDEAEILANPRARSAKLRVAEKK